jgi:hypothetical protein
MSRIRKSFTVAFVTGLALSGPLATAQAVKTNARPSVRVTDKVNVSVTSRVAGTHPAIVDSASIGARVAAGAKLSHLHLFLTATDAQEAALASLTDQQQDKTSPNFHHWMTPETFGASFGAAPSDVAKVVAWLQDQGLTVESVSKSNRVISFGGSAGQIEAAFQTELHTLTVNGETHISNTTDISVPSALAGVIGGVARLNDFFPKSGAHRMGIASLTRMLPANNFISQDTAPLYGNATGTHYIAPGDVATIYNAKPLVTGGTDGTGVTIAILAQSNINLGDVQQFRSMFGLPKNDPTIILVGGDPGTNGDDGEAYLDAEWSGAVATGAKVDFLVSSPDLENGGVDASGLYAVDNNIGDIISLSYGGCEVNNGPGVTGFFNTLWEQAAAQGQTVFVSTGDSSADTCASSSSAYATSDYGVNALGSSAYNVAVGGTAFVDYGQSTYWANGGTTIPFSNALSYIPEAPWNNSKLSTTNLNSASTGLLTGSGISGTGGGISIYTARPNWQTGSGISPASDPAAVSGTGIAPGSPISGPHRLVPDVSNISANNHDGALFCADSVCSTTPTGGLYDAGVVGGTSVATPVQAGLQALINEKNGGRQGNANYYYYQLANAQYTASTTACQATLGTASSPTVTLPASTCNFHDVVSGSNAVPTSSTDTTGIGFLAAPGYDAASGLGSVDITNVATNWSTVAFTATTTTLSITPQSGIAHGADQTINVTVSPTTGSGTPTGDFALIAQTTSPDGPFEYTLTNGAFSGLVASSNKNVTIGVASTLPAGNYNVYARYAGDGTFGGSVSAPVPVSIGKDTSSVSLNSYDVTAAGYVFAQTSFPYGANLYIDTYVNSGSGSGVPTGTVTYSVSKGGTALASLTNTLDATGNTYFQSGQSFPNFYLKANYPALAPGSYTITAAYSGDNNFAASTSSVNVTVTQLTPTVSFTAPADINSGDTATFGYRIANPASVTYPNTTVLATGMVTFTDTTSGTTLGSCTLSGAACTFSSTAITTAGGHTVTAVYSGDLNYAPASNSATVMVGTLTAPTVAVTSAGTLAVGSTITLTATLTPATATGSVSFFDGTTLLGVGTISSGVATFRSAGTLGAGTRAISAVYSGSTSNASATGTLSLTVAKNSPSMTLSAPLNSTYGQVVSIDVQLSRSPTTSGQPTIPPTGLVTFTDSGSPIGSGALTYGPGGYGLYGSDLNIATLGVGTHTLSATYAGDTNYNTATAAFTVSTTIAKLSPAITVSSPSVAYSSLAAVPLTATLAIPSTLTAPTAQVSFYDGATFLGSATPTYSAAAGAYIANYSAVGLSGASHSITAQYPGDTSYNLVTSPPFLVSVTTSNVWVLNANGKVSALTNSGTALFGSAVGSTGTGTGIAIDGSGNVWSLNSTANSVQEFSNAGTVISSGYTGGGINLPAALSFDGAGLLWIANGNNTISVLNSSGAPVTSVPFQSPLNTPTSINVDGSGSVWVTNSGNNTVTEVIGAATPVTTPLTTAVTNNTLASKP